MRVLLVDDDPALRALLRATMASAQVEIAEAASAVEALSLIQAERPDVVVLDVYMPGMDGIELCGVLKRDTATAELPIVLLTGGHIGEDAAAAAGADAFLGKPFSPLQLLALVEQLAGGLVGVPFRARPDDGVADSLLLYARDLRDVLEIERGQRAALQAAYAETVTVLANALESKDMGTGAHSQRVQQYAGALAAHVGDQLSTDPSVDYGFLLHDVGKIGIPDVILQKPGPLAPDERLLMQTHTILGEQMLGGVAYLQGEGIRIVRSHHERWDGHGYPDRLAGEEIPLGARVFAVADALDAMTCDRPYRRALDWGSACREIGRGSGSQFDPDVVAVFGDVAEELLHICREFVVAA